MKVLEASFVLTCMFFMGHVASADGLPAATPVYDCVTKATYYSYSSNSYDLPDVQFTMGGNANLVQKTFSVEGMDFVVFGQMYRGQDQFNNTFIEFYTGVGQGTSIISGKVITDSTVHILDGEMPKKVSFEFGVANGPSAILLPDGNVGLSIYCTIQ